jgi:hypothetical protein
MRSMLKARAVAAALVLPVVTDYAQDQQATDDAQANAQSWAAARGGGPAYTGAYARYGRYRDY